MSKRFKRVANTEKAVLAHLSQDSGLLPLSDVPVERRPYASRDAGLHVAPQGLVYGPTGVFSHVGGPPQMLTGHPVDETSDVILSLTGNKPDDERVAKNQRLWNRWEKEVIPSMVKPFLELLSSTSSLREMGTVRQSWACIGCKKGRLLGVFCIFVDRESQTFIAISCPENNHRH